MLLYTDLYPMCYVPNLFCTQLVSHSVCAMNDDCRTRAALLECAASRQAPLPAGRRAAAAAGDSLRKKSRKTKKSLEIQVIFYQFKHGFDRLLI